MGLIQSQFDQKYYTSGGLFEKRVVVGISREGNLRVTSGQGLSTSSIRLTTMSGTASTDLWGQGRFSATPTTNTAVDAKLPDDVSYDPLTYATIPNENVFAYDDGYSRIFGAANGSINYETGACDFRAKPNSEFVVSALINSAFSGKLNESEGGRINSLVEILANTPNQKWNGSVMVRAW